MDIEYPTMEDVEQNGVLWLRKHYRFLPAPQTEEQHAILIAIGAKIMEQGQMTLPLRMEQGLDVMVNPKQDYGTL